MHAVSNVATIEGLLGKIGPQVKKSALLSGDWKGPYAVAAIVIDDALPPAEVHQYAADVWIALKGTSRFILGGEMVDPVEPNQGELSAASITGGEECEVGPGDVVDIPAGVPHQVDARGKRAEFLIIKIQTNHG